MARTDSASRVVAAAPERVFAALVDPEALVAWLPPEGMTGRFDHVDFAADDPAFAGTMTMTWTTTPVAGGTRVEIVAAEVPPGITAEDHAMGLASSLANLARYVEGASR